MEIELGWDIGESVQSEEEEEEENLAKIPLRRSTRKIKCPTRLRNFITYKVKYLIHDYIAYDTNFFNHN